MTYQASPRVLIVGLGRSGLAAARLAIADGSEVWITDLRPESDLRDQITQLSGEERAFYGGHPEGCLDGVGLVIVSPGVPADADVLERAQNRGIKVVSEVEFAWGHRPDAPLVAVTGSNGKSTVTELVALMLRAGGRSAAAGGNLGTAASRLVHEGGWECWVLEISSFQAELLTDMQPRVAVFLNLSQDHLERHSDMEHYLAAKRRLFAFQGPHDVAVLSVDDEAVARTPTVAPRKTFSVVQPADGYRAGEDLVVNGERLMTVSDLRLSGLHNVANALAAALAAAALGAPHEAIASALREFDGLEHRHRTVVERDGVRWVDDSKATNVGATLAALGGYDEHSVHLILGGQAKGQDFGPLVSEIRRTVVRLYLIGEDEKPIGEALAGAAPIEMCETLLEAVQRARRQASAGQCVLLAPACASFDQFSGYHERGEVFAELAKQEAAPCR